MSTRKKKDEIVKGGWYRLTYKAALEGGGTTKKRGVAQCIGTGRYIPRLSTVSYTFNFGLDEDPLTISHLHAIVHPDDIISAVRLSPRYIETTLEEKGLVTHERFSSPPGMRYGD